MEEEEMDLLKKEHSGADEEDKQVPLNTDFDKNSRFHSGVD